MQMATTPETRRVFRRFSHLEEAADFASELEALGFEAETVIDAPFQDPLIVGNGTVWHLVKLDPAQFELAEAALLTKAGGATYEVPDDHYLHGFSDEELTSILIKPDEWSAEDAIWAQELLRQRGKPVSAEALRMVRETRLEDLRQEAPPQTPWIFFGYVSAFLGGFLGIAIGWYLNTSKRTLPNGERVHVYRREDRVHGARMVFIGVPLFAAAIGRRFWYAFSR
ncbi:MAG: hypothetical protein WAT74_08360 [Flavobacteriales bacterium]